LAHVSPAVFRGLLLDLDDTLYDRRPAFVAWAEATARAQLGRGLAIEELDGLCAIDRRGHRSRAQFAGDARRLYGLAVDPDRFPFELAEHLVPEPGARETIAAIARTRRVAVVTNGGPAQRVKLAKVGLADVVHAVFVSHELGVAKPAPAMFERALRWSELPAADVLMVGDMPAIDLAPAAVLGMATAWRQRSEWPAELAPPAYVIRAVTQLAEICP
jgi:HAD superfamily hydrolase (TIGR01509 family)